ncbi:FRIGIDA-like protein 3 isoform X2 [Ananas comosus]|uniref:FRIGIDA-like protein n=1 Tax=Ananas comosus TaxID=4615 RepID=A0A6P5FFC5_ANACO|nr:FRIGIDA-like protein 3 isoform X2 [Ananas comosus]
MENDVEAAVGMKSATGMLEQLGKAFEELKSHTEASLENTIKWDDIKEHFLKLEKSFKDKFDELEQKQKELEDKQSKAHAVIAEKEEAVAAKERASLQRLQELRDAAVSDIAEAREKHKVETSELFDLKASREKKVTTSLNESNAPNGKAPANGSAEPTEAVAFEVKPSPRVKQLCEQMDTKGLLKFISDNMKSLATLRKELSVALKYANEPALLVLSSLEGFYPQDELNSQGNDDEALQGLRRSCLVVMESAAPVFAVNEQSANCPLSSEIKQRAKAIADEWKPKLATVDIDSTGGYSLEAQAFLQLLATFGLNSEFDEDELFKLVLAVSHCRMTPRLCRSLGFAQKVPVVIETLVNRGRHIDAVHFVDAFQLFESYPPVSLLKAYLEASKAPQKDPLDRELGALKAVSKCVRERKLHKEFPLGPIQKRINLLEKAKSDNKRAAAGGATRFQPKRPRPTGKYTHRGPAVGADKQPPPQMAYDGGYYAVYNAQPPAYDASAYAATYGQHYSTEAVPPPASYNAAAASYYGPYAAAAPPQPSPSAKYSNYASAGAQAPAASYYGSYPSSGSQSTNQPYM